MPDTREEETIAAILAAPLHRLLGLRLIDPADPAAGVEIDVGPAAGDRLVATGQIVKAIVPAA